jgi:tetratricopeptide (TPR) repeat protein
MNAIRILTALALAGTLGSAANAAPESKPQANAASTPNVSGDAVAARRALDQAVAHGTLQDILAARVRFVAVAAAQPKSPWAHYWVAVSDWRAVPRFDDKAKALAEKTCDEALAQIDRAIALTPGEGEFHALRSNLLGMSLRFHPEAMMTIGGEIEASMQRAIAAAPSNPRVQLLAALNTLNKPAFVGGGADRALPLFRKSQQLFESAAAPADSTAPVWGRDDAWLWAGRTAMKLGDAATARDCYVKTLEITPGHAWVTHALLPEAEKALAAAAKGK